MNRLSVPQEVEWITCVVCGHSFDPQANPSSCATCPMHADCSMACCPNCGASNINPAGSKLATWMKTFLRGKHV